MRMRRLAKENDKKRRGELIRITSGIADRVNPDYAKQPKAARIEESLLGMLFIHPEEVEKEYPIPSAFENYVKYVNVKIGQEKFEK